MSECYAIGRTLYLEGRLAFSLQSRLAVLW